MTMLPLDDAGPPTDFFGGMTGLLGGTGGGTPLAAKDETADFFGVVGGAFPVGAVALAAVVGGGSVALVVT